MRRIYVAGAYSAPDVVAALDNIRRGIRLATEVLLAGYAPFCPWLDCQYQLMLKDGERLTVDDYYNYSLAWLEASDAVIIVPERLEQSEGTLRELIRARELGLPVYSSMEELRNGL